MNLVPVKTPAIVKRLFPKYVWDIPTTDKVLYLTFDDGPTPEITEWTLDILNQFNAKATFFCLGDNIEKNPGIFYRILDEGHAVGNHTFHHARGWKTKTDVYVKEVLRTQIVIENLILNSEFRIQNLFRPPYGQITLQQGYNLLKLGYKIIMWDVIAFDWKDSISGEKCQENVISKAKSGSIVVFHDSLKASKNMQYALPKVLDYFSKKGFEFKRIPE